MRKPTDSEIEHAAQSQAMMDTAREMCDPTLAFNNWVSTHGFFNAWNMPLHEFQQSQREKATAYKLFVKAYLNQQGWVSTR